MSEKGTSVERDGAGLAQSGVGASAATLATSLRGDVAAQGPTEFAREMALLVRRLDVNAREQLRQLLGHDLAVPSVGERREAVLGLLIELVSDGSGVVPTVAEYAAARSREAAVGRDWPSPSMLSAHFGDWLGAVRSATLLVVRGPASRVPASRGAWFDRPAEYSRDEVCRAIAQCADSSGEWPSDVLFTEWRRTVRLVALAAGCTDEVRVPGRKAMMRHFGTYSNALDAAKRARLDGRL
jgi:hypothetical protein